MKLYSGRELVELAPENYEIKEAVIATEIVDGLFENGEAILYESLKEGKVTFTSANFIMSDSQL